MQVYIQVKRTAETLNQCDRTGVRCGFCVTGFFANVRGDGAIDDAQGFAHDAIKSTNLACSGFDLSQHRTLLFEWPSPKNRHHYAICSEASIANGYSFTYFGDAQWHVDAYKELGFSHVIVSDLAIIINALKISNTSRLLYKTPIYNKAMR
jgi:hypothetical protein